MKSKRAQIKSSDARSNAYKTNTNNYTFDFFFYSFILHDPLRSAS